MFSIGHYFSGAKHAFFSRMSPSDFLLYTKDLQKDGDTLLLPVYMAPFI